MQQLNDPTVSTPNTPVFDFRTGETVEVAYVTGGAPNLSAENARSLKLSANWQPYSARDLRFNLAYTRTDTDDQIASFPTITPRSGSRAAGTVPARQRRNPAVHRRPSAELQPPRAAGRAMGLQLLAPLRQAKSDR